VAHRESVEGEQLTRGWRTTRRSRRAKRHSDAEPAREDYTGAFARVRLVRAWIAAAASLVAMVSAYVALLERIFGR
jgi:hypothetical protein